MSSLLSASRFFEAFEVVEVIELRALLLPDAPDLEAAVEVRLRGFGATTILRSKPSCSMFFCFDALPVREEEDVAVVVMAIGSDVRLALDGLLGPGTADEAVGSTIDEGAVLARSTGLAAGS